MTYSKDTWRGKTKDKMRRERGEKKGSCDRNGGWRRGGGREGENVPAPEPHQEENT
jgi:hypothetical protein